MILLYGLMVLRLVLIQVVLFPSTLTTLDFTNAGGSDNFLRKHKTNPIL
jgi:hypothetical protein